MLIVPRATPHDEGMYYCMAGKEGISIESRRATIAVDGKELCYYELLVIKNCLQIS